MMEYLHSLILLILAVLVGRNTLAVNRALARLDEPPKVVTKVVPEKVETVEFPLDLIPEGIAMERNVRQVQEWQAEIDRLPVGSPKREAFEARMRAMGVA